MTHIGFKRSLSNSKPPAGISVALAGLWWAGKDDWNRAHKLVMSEDDPCCAWVHAHLHRREGDLDNARYWYGQAGRPVAVGDLAAEWAMIVAALLRSKSV